MIIHPGTRALIAFRQQEAFDIIKIHSIAEQLEETLLAPSDAIESVAVAGGQIARAQDAAVFITLREVRAAAGISE